MYSSVSELFWMRFGVRGGLLSFFECVRLCFGFVSVCVGSFKCI